MKSFHRRKMSRDPVTFDQNFDALIFFCEKTTVLAEKVFHPAAGEAQLTALCHMLSLFYQAE